MAGARRFNELHCWQLSDRLKTELYRILRRPSVRRDVKFVEQVRDAGFAHFLDYSRASLNECQAHIKDACDRGYITLAEFTCLIRLARRATAATAALQKYLRNSPDPPDAP